MTSPTRYFEIPTEVKENLEWCARGVRYKNPERVLEVDSETADNIRKAIAYAEHARREERFRHDLLSDYGG